MHTSRAFIPPCNLQSSNITPAGRQLLDQTSFFTDRNPSRLIQQIMTITSLNTCPVLCKNSATLNTNKLVNINQQVRNMKSIMIKRKEGHISARISITHNKSASLRGARPLSDNQQSIWNHPGMNVTTVLSNGFFKRGCYSGVNSTLILSNWGSTAYPSTTTQLRPLFLALYNASSARLKRVSSPQTQTETPKLAERVKLRSL